MPVKTIRYYDDIDLVTPASRTASGYRIYDNAAIQKLIFIRRAREFGFSINECRELLNLYNDETRSSASVKHLAMQRLKQIIEKQKELQSLHNELSYLIHHCRGDDDADCPIIDSLSGTCLSNGAGDGI